MPPRRLRGGGKSTAGKLITKPIAHINAKLKPVATTILAAAVVMRAGRNVGSWPCGFFRLDRRSPFAAVGLLVISPPLTVAAYEMLRDDEFEPYRGRSLYLRSAACGWAYASLWGVFAMLSPHIVTGEVWNWFFVCRSWRSAHWCRWALSISNSATAFFTAAFISWRRCCSVGRREWRRFGERIEILRTNSREPTAPGMCVVPVRGC